MNKWQFGICAAALSMTLLAGCGNKDSTSYESQLVDADTEQAAEILTAAPEAEETAEPETTPAEAVPTEEVTETPTPAAPIEALEITPNPDPDEGLKLIGEKKEGTSIYRKKITNATGKNITGFFIRDQWMEDWPDNMLDRTDVWKDMEARYLYFDADETLKRSANYEEKPVYRILILFEGDDEAVLHDIPMEDMSEVQIVRDGDLYYLKYRSIADLSDRSTEEIEKGRTGGEIIEETVTTTVTEETVPADTANEEQPANEDQTPDTYDDEDEYDGDDWYVDEEGEGLAVYVEEDPEAVG